MGVLAKLFISLVIITVSCHGYAWNALAHMVIADIAYEQLKPDVRKKVDIMVADLSQEYPDINQFSHIAPWPDKLRSQRIELYTHWHYINLAFSDDGTALKDMSDTDNAVWAINALLPIISNPKANPHERARSLAFLVHIVGDLHQPLHAITRISAAHPDGDHGGNLYYIKYPAVKPQKISMHKLWDQGTDLFTMPVSDSNAASLSAFIVNLFPYEYFGELVNDLASDHWANEGLAISSSFVYSTPPNVVPDTSYLQTAKQVAEQRAALAGYRLANILNKILV